MVGRDLISGVAAIYYFKCLVFLKKYETCKEHKLCAIHRETKSQLIEIILMEAQTLDKLDKDKSVTINILKELKEIMSKGMMENVRTISHQAENINKEIEIIKRNQRNFVPEKLQKLK